MPSLALHQSAATTKMLVLGNSGVGKTGALACLAKAGYNLRILDFDNGADILMDLLRDTPEALERVVYELCIDKLKAVNGIIMPDGPPKGWSRALNLLTHWKVAETKDDARGVVYPAYDLGPINKWGPKDILVVDTLSMMCNMVMRHTLMMGGIGPGTRPRLQDWGAAQDALEGFLAMLYSDDVKCNVIVNSHIGFYDDEGSVGDDRKGYANVLGKKLAPKLGRYFNSVVQVKTIGSGPALKRQIITSTEGPIDLKNPAPSRMPRTLDHADGLLKFFNIVRGAEQGV